MLESERDQAAILSLFLFDMMDGSLTCSRGDDCKYDHNPVIVTRNQDTGNVTIAPISGCMSMTLDRSGKPVWSMSSIRPAGITRWYLLTSTGSSKTEKQNDQCPFRSTCEIEKRSSVTINSKMTFSPVVCHHCGADFSILE